MWEAPDLHGRILGRATVSNRSEPLLKIPDAELPLPAEAHLAHKTGEEQDDLLCRLQLRAMFDTTPHQRTGAEKLHSSLMGEVQRLTRLNKTCVNYVARLEAMI